MNGATRSGADMPDVDMPNLQKASIESATELIEAAQSGQPEAWNKVYELLYKELHGAARMQLRRWGKGGSATSLINRAWLRFDPDRLTLGSRQHLLGVLSRAMRYALLDEARRLTTTKRHAEMSSTEDALDKVGYDPQLDELLALDHALDALTAADPRLGQLVEMRYFGGLSEIEIANALGLTDRTIRRDWRKARAFLAAQLDATSPSPDRDD